MNIKLIIALLITSSISFSQSLQDYYNKAREAYQQKDYLLFYENISKSAELHPYHQGILYQKAIAATLTQKPEEAVALLQKAILMNASFDLTVDDLKSLQERKDFQSVLELQQALKKPIATSDTAFVLPDRQLHAEGISVGLKPGTFFVTSIHKRKVIYIDETGQTSDFIVSKQDGLGATMSVKADAKTKTLWVASVNTPEMIDYDSTLTSSVYQYDLRTKKLLNRYATNDEIKDSFFGDLILTRNGRVLISDSKNNIIFTVNTSTQELEPFFSSETFWNIQGISFSDDERFLFIADYIKGIYRLNMETKELVAISSDAVIALKGIDGLLYHKNSLIVIQNGIAPMRVVQLRLNHEHDRIISAYTLDHAHPSFNEPTNGCVVNNELYYIANSQWNGYDDKKKIKPDDQLQDIIVLKTSLTR